MSGTLPSSGVPLRGVMARWDAMVIRWGLHGDECTALLGRGDLGPVDDPESYGTVLAENRMRLLVTLEPIVAAVFDGDEERVREWLRRPNRNLRQRTPIQVMTASPQWIRWLIDAVGVVS